LNELYTTIPDWVSSSAKDCAQILGDQVYRENPFVSGAGPITKDIVELILNKTWRPQLAITGQAGLPSIEQSGNVLRSSTSFKLSMRIPPHVNPTTAAQAMKRVLEENPPYGFQVQFDVDKASYGWAAPALTPYLDKSLRNASQIYFNQPLMMWGEGGSIPFMQMLGEEFPKAQFVVTGVLGPGSNAHGPNEFLHIPFTKRLICCVSNVLADHSTHLMESK